MSVISLEAKYRVIIGWTPERRWWFQVATVTDSGNYCSGVEECGSYASRDRADAAARRAIADDRKRRASHEVYEVPLDEPEQAP